MEVQSVRFLVGTSRGDRLFQMNYALYAYQGRLAQLHGDVWDALDYDKSMRLRGQWRRAVAAAQNLGEDSLILLEAYSAGVNEWMAAHPEDRHALFAELDMEPITWTPARCLASWLRLGQFFTGSTGLDKAGDYHDFLATEQGQGTEAAIAAYWERQRGACPTPGTPMPAWSRPRMCPRMCRMPSPPTQSSTGTAMLRRPRGSPPPPTRSTTTTWFPR